MKTVLLIDNGSGDVESFTLGTFEEPNADAVRCLLNAAHNAEADTNSPLKMWFEQWDDKQIKKAELYGEFDGGHIDAEEYEKQVAALG